VIVTSLDAWFDESLAPRKGALHIHGMTSEQKDRVALLCEALWSGEYKQGRTFLRTGDEYCCMGVACDVMRRVTGRGEWRRGDYFEIDASINESVLPLPVADWYGFDDLNPEMPSHDGRSAAYLNDTDELSVPEIAAAFFSSFVLDE
jgi:hypothetical protein